MNGNERDATIDSEANAIRSTSSDDNCLGAIAFSGEAASAIPPDADGGAVVDFDNDNDILETENLLESNSNKVSLKPISTSLEETQNQASVAVTVGNALAVAAVDVSNTTQNTNEDADAISVSNALHNSENIASSSLSTNVEIIPETSEEESQQLANVGIDRNYPLVLVQRLSLSEINRYVTDEQENSSDLVTNRQETNSINAINTESGNEESMVEPMSNANENQLGEDDGDDADDIDDDDDDSIGFERIERFITSYRSGFWNSVRDLANGMPDDYRFRRGQQNAPNNAYDNLSAMIEMARHNMLEEDAAIADHYPALEILRRQGIIHRFRRILFNLNSRITALRLALPQTEGNENYESSAVNDHNEISDDNASQDDQEHQTANSSNDQDPSGMDVDEALEPEFFDTSLPAEHSYMGNNMDRVSGVGYLEEGQNHNVMLFMHQHVIFPGEILPLMISDIIIDDINNQQNGFLFGVCFPLLNDIMSSNMLLGVTCQIYERGRDEHGNTLIKSRALQRFVTKVNELASPLEYINEQPQMKCFGNIKILPDIYLPEPLKCLNMGSMNRFRDNDSMSQAYKRFQASSTPFPTNVYDNYSVTKIIEKARTQLAQHKIDTMPSDPLQLSYWLVRNLHIPDNLLYEIFTTNIVNTRLKLIASTFKEVSLFICRYCGIYVASCRELFAMSKHGIQTQYCNSGGYIHETNTVYQVNKQSIIYSGSPSTHFSWFPGYKWHIIICKICKHHLGWEFTAVKENLVPKVFYGISSASVRMRLIQPSNSPRLYSILNVSLGSELITE